MSPELVWPADGELLSAVLDWARERRWFPLKGAVPPAGRCAVVADVALAPGVRDLVIALPTGGAQDAARVLLHVPLVLGEAADLARLTGPKEAEGAAGLLLEDGTALVDGAHHPAFWQAWAAGVLEAGTALSPTAARAVVQRAERLRVSTGEQSNTSVILPAPTGSCAPAGAEDAETPDLIVKLLRVLEPGRNPDVEVPVALARGGWDRVPAPVAWSSLDLLVPGSSAPVSADAAVATTFVPGAEDGFALFCALAGDDDGPGAPTRLRALALADALGETTAQMHEHLAAALGTSAPVPAAALAQALRARAAWAMREVPALAEEVPGLAQRVEDVLGALAALPGLPAASRVHGDYHLGQTLLGAGGHWYVLDFEGEPLRPLAERRVHDQPLRDVAGMLRSFDYAAAVGGASDGTWSAQVRQSFLDGYRRVLPATVGEAGRDAAVIAALELDKAFYEAVYEARHRPGWLPVPLAGIHRVLGTKSPSVPDTHGRVERMSDVTAPDPT
ncbi:MULTISPECIES: phosphotransferase, partial [unclassified Actinomyces]|uniref:phosphotransferase n=2 Tax=Actinomyces TaxID=1654 RepID=UPI002017AC37